MRETLEALEAGEISVDEAESTLAGYATTEAGRFDATRQTRSGIPEAIISDGKTAGEIADLAATALETTDRAIVTRIRDEDVETVRDQLHDSLAPSGEITHNARARVLIARTEHFQPPDLDATVAVVSAGTSDAPIAGEAATIAGEMGATVRRVEDVGVASLARVLDQLDILRAADVIVVAAGREGALPTVVAGLIDVPVIGLPVGTGYGHGGEGKAALGGMLQSCTELSVVNIDAGYVAGAQAGLIARAIDTARQESG